MGIKLRHLDQNKDRELLVFHYVQALDNGDLETVSEVLAACQRDAELERMIDSVNDALAQELGITVLPVEQPTLPTIPAAT